MQIIKHLSLWSEYYAKINLVRGMSEIHPGKLFGPASSPLAIKFWTEGCTKRCFLVWFKSMTPKIIWHVALHLHFCRLHSRTFSGVTLVIAVLLSIAKLHHNAPYKSNIQSARLTLNHQKLSQNSVSNMIIKWKAFNKYFAEIWGCCEYEQDSWYLQWASLTKKQEGQTIQNIHKHCFGAEPAWNT